MSESIVAIIQARMASTRLPGKIILPLAGKPCLWHVIERLGNSKHVQKTIVATTIHNEDNVVVKFCSDYGILCFRGSEKDVLDRYYRAAKTYDADPVVRITADCPVVDPTVVDEVIDCFLKGSYDVYSLGGEFPDGLDCSVYSFRALEEAWENAELPSEREHVGPYLSKHPERFKLGKLEKFSSLGYQRWTLDEEDDYRFLSEVFNRLYQPGQIFLTGDILKLLKNEPQLLKINSHIPRNEGFLKSLDEDRKFLREKRGST